MTSKKILAYVWAFLLVVQSPLSTFAETPIPTTSIEEAFMQWFVQGFNNPTDTLDESMKDLKPSPREQFHIDRITKQLEAIINKAPTNEDRIQKAINVNVYLLDTLVKHSKGMIEKAIAWQNDPVAMASLEKEIIATHFKSKVKIIAWAIMQISDIYLSPEIDEYMTFSDDFQDEANQKDIDTAVQKITALVNMVDSAFENYAPEINKLMKTHIWIGTKELFQHTRVLSFFGLQMMMDEEKFSNYYVSQFDEPGKYYKILNQAFEYLNSELVKADTGYFMFRDFQPRNIMLKNDSLYFIDYQSGRKGPLHYDLASFLYSGSIELTDEEREFLLKSYLNDIKYKTDKREFMKLFKFFILIRLIQVLGSYGYSFHKNKEKKYLDKIQKALANMKSLLGQFDDKIIDEFIYKLTERLNYWYYSVREADGSRAFLTNFVLPVPSEFIMYIQLVTTGSISAGSELFERSDFV